MSISLTKVSGQKVTTLSITDQTGKLTSRDANYSYVDSLVNDCLAKIDLCQSGEIFVFNVNVTYQSFDTNNEANSCNMNPNYGRVVLYSSGGDSAYTPGGVYLHQVGVRGDYYIELGFTYRAQMYTIKVCYKKTFSNPLSLALMTWFYFYSSISITGP